MGIKMPGFGRWIGRQMTMRVKICGLRSPEEAALAVSAGADAVGINLVGGPRRVDLATADAIVRAVGSLVSPVLLVRLRDGALAADELEWLRGHRIRGRKISHLQLYGDVTADAVGRLLEEDFRPIVVVSVRSEDFADEVKTFLNSCGRPGPTALLLDAYAPDKTGGTGKLGGTGKTFEWSWVRQARARGDMAGWPPVILAGGLTPDNVADAIRETMPHGVDVASGVESAGKKDEAKMRAFVAAARAALVPEE